MKLLNKILSFISAFSLIFYQVSFPLAVLAQEATPSASEEQAVNPSPDPSLSPSETPTPSDVPEVSPTPSVEPSSTPTPSSDQRSSSTTVGETGQPNAPPSASPTPTPAATISPTPSVTLSNETNLPNAYLAVTVLENTDAETIPVLDLDPSNIESSVTLTTDKADYAPTDTAVISGTGLTPNTTYILTVSSEDDPATSTTENVTTGDNGSFIYTYQLDGNYRPNYSVVLKDENGTVVASTTFTDSRTVNSATLNGSSSVTVSPSSTIAAVVNVTTDTSGTGAVASRDDWKSTGWLISTTAPGSVTCVNHADHTTAGTYNETFDITAPSSTGTYNAYFIAYNDDTCTSGASVTITLTSGVIVNDQPSFDPISNQSVNEDSSAQDISITNISPGANESGQTVTLSATSSNTSIVPNPTFSGAGSTRTLSYAPVANANGSTTITVTADDGQAQNNTFSRTFTITVNAVNDSPFFDAIANQTIDENAPAQNISITNISPGPADESGQTVTLTTTSSDPSVIPNPTISGSGSTQTLSYTPVTNATGTVTITVTANDGQDNFSRTFTITVNPDTTSPIITINNPSSTPAQSKTITASTNEGALTMSNTTGSVCDGTLSFIAYSSQTFTSESDNGEKVCYRAVDGVGNTSYSMSSAITGIDTTPPVTNITSATDGNSNVVSSGGLTKSNSISIAFNATDANGVAGSECKIDAGSYAACSNPKSYSSLSDGSHTVSIRSTDNAGNIESTATFTWTVDTTAPIITIDPYSTDPTNIDITVNASTEVGSTLNFTSHTFSTNDSFDFVATDEAGNVTTETVTITNIDKSLPTFGPSPSDSTGTTGETAIIRTTAIDDVAVDKAQISVDGTDYVDMTFVNSLDLKKRYTYDVAIPSNSTAEITYQVKIFDVAGNFATSDIKTITVTDNDAPVIDFVSDIAAAEATSTSGADVTYDAPSTTDEVDGPGVAICDPSSGSTFALGDTTVICTATDLAGNSAISTFNVNVVDTTPPEIALAGDDPQTIGVGTAYNELGATAADIYDGDLTASIAIDSTNVDTSIIGTYTVTYDVTDTTGNPATQVTRTINVVDTQAPGITYNYPTAGGQTSWYNSNPGAVIDIDFIWGGGSPLDNASKDYGSGFTNIFTADQSSDYTTNWGLTNLAWDSLSEGANPINIKVADTAGNTKIDNYSAGISGFLFRKDTVAPSTTDNSDGAWHNSAVTVNLSCTDANSLCANTYYTTNGDDPVTSGTIGTSINLSTDGIYDLKYYSKDNANNSENVHIVLNAVKIDTTAPTQPVPSVAAGDYATDQPVTLTSSDTNGYTIYYTTDGTTPSNASTLYTGSAINVDKDMIIKAIAYDPAGNPSPILSATYGIAPVISAESTSSATGTSFTVTWTTDDPATSRVIYDTVSHPVLGAAPNYDYANSTVEDSTLVTSHSVTVTGLSANTTYFYRTVSHGSPETVGSEQSVTTAAVLAAATTGGGGGGGGNDGGDGLGCAVHDCSIHPAPQTLVSAVVSILTAAGFTPEVLGVTSETGNVGVGQESQVQGEATESAQEVTTTVQPQKTAQSPFNAGVILVIIIALLLGFGVFKLIIK